MHNLSATKQLGFLALQMSKGLIKREQLPTCLPHGEWMLEAASKVARRNAIGPRKAQFQEPIA